MNRATFPDSIALERHGNAAIDNEPGKVLKARPDLRR